MNIIKNKNCYLNQYVIHIIIQLNGLYDIICGLLILLFPNFNHLHYKLYKKHFHFMIEHNNLSSINLSSLNLTSHNLLFQVSNNIIKRLLAYWIITYGIIRLFYINKSNNTSNNISNNISNYSVLATYIIEIIVWFNEFYIYNLTYFIDSFFVIFMCVYVCVCACMSLGSKALPIKKEKR